MDYKMALIQLLRIIDVFLYSISKIKACFGNG